MPQYILQNNQLVLNKLNNSAIGFDLRAHLSDCRFPALFPAKPPEGDLSMTFLWTTGSSGGRMDMCK